MNAKKEWLSVEQAAEYAQVSVSLVYEWCSTRLTHYRLGTQNRRGKIFIDPADLDAFLQTLKVTPVGDEWPD